MSTEVKEQPAEVIAIEMAKDREQRRIERQALVEIPASDITSAPLRTSFMPQSMGEAMQLATIMARSTFVPGHCRGSEGNCLAIIMQAGRWGMDPFAVANKAYFVRDGAPPAFEAQLVNAVVNSSGALSGRLRIEFEGEGQALRCTVRGFLRADPNEEKVRTQSIARITVQNSPLWKSDPEQQLGYYTTRAWARLHCPEVLLGVYTPDEMEIEPERARVVSRRMPLRDDPPVQDEEEYDADTGEVIQRDARGMTIVNEDTARKLDAGQPNDGTLAQDNPAVAEGPAQVQRGEENNGADEPQADYVGPVTPESAQRGQTWYNPEDGKLRHAHQTPKHGIKWYMQPQQDEPAAKEPDKPAEPTLAQELREAIAGAGDTDALEVVRDRFSESKPKLTGNDITEIRGLIATRSNDLS